MLLLTHVLLIMLSVGTIFAAPHSDRSDGTAEVGSSRQKRETQAMLDLLSKYGYLQNIPQSEGQLHSLEVITEAIRHYQKFNGLRVSGTLDETTMKKMKSPRCGASDIIVNDNHSSNFSNNMPFGYTTMGSRWPKNKITWYPTQLSAKLNQRDQLSAIQKALNLWAEVTPLSFQLSQQDPDIVIMFARGEHGDGVHNSFNGKGGVLAHAYMPGLGAGGDAHFDEDEMWTLGTGEGVDLITVAAHEFGHSLGLGHSSEPEALMAPYYKYSDKLSLHNDDVQGIRSIYGRKPDTSSSRMPETPATTTTSTTTRTRTRTTPTTITPTTIITSTTTRRPTTSTNNRRTKGPTPTYCDVNFRLDAISLGHDSLVYAFRDDVVYRFNGKGLESGYPKRISQVFPQAPENFVNAVTFVPETKKTYIFKGTQVWRFTNFILDKSYPKTWTDDRRYIPLAALTLTYKGHSQIFMFGADNFWEWSKYTETLVPGYPMSVQTYFPYAPGRPDAALMNHLGHFFFFKDNSYKRLEQRGRDTDFKALSPNLFGSVCGGDPELLGQLVQASLTDQRANDRISTQNHQPEFSPKIWDLINTRNNGTGETNSARRLGFFSSIFG